MSLAGSHWRADGGPKSRFATQKEALDAADERSRESGATLGVYFCTFCRGWHMGGRSGRAGGDV
ncbi:MAG: hypothetical protein ACYDHU_11625 [Acidimicrobiales bacterium]